MSKFPVITHVPMTVKRIQEFCEQLPRPVTVQEIATELDLNPQTIRNHIETAIKHGFIRQTQYKMGKAYTYESTNRVTSLLPVVILSGEDTLLRDAFIKFARNNTVQMDSPIGKVFEIVSQLYALVVAYTDSNNEIHYSDKVTLLKEQKAKLRKLRDSFKNLLDLTNSIYMNEKLWEPKDLIKALLIIDEDMDTETIRSYIEMINNKS